MSDRPFELAWTPEGMVARVRLRGSSVLSSPMLNRGTAFTRAEREALGVRLRALQQLLDETGRENFSEVRWLESEIRTTSAALERGDA